MGRDVDFPEEWKIARPNALILIPKVNEILDILGFTGPRVVSSGFRPSAINQKIPNAAKNSLHMIGKAIDIADPDGELKKLLTPITNKDHADLLRRFGVFMEHPDYTPTWVHLDIGQRVDRPSRVFIPY